MTSQTQLGLLRHGQTDWNIDFRLQGVTDIPLNATGIAQAEAAAERILRADWDVVMTSPLSRAKDTAEIVMHRAGFNLDDLIVEPLLLERSFGVAEGMLHSDWKANYGDVAIEGAESREQLAARTELLLGVIAERYAGKRVLAVSHGALIREVLGQISLGTLPPQGERISNACLNRFEHERAVGWSVVEYDPKPLA